MSKSSKVILPIVFGLFVLVNAFNLVDGYNWNDDTAQYILHALNLIEHRAYSENMVVDLWVVVPPGFPLILSSLIYWLGINFKALKFLNIVFWGLAGFSAYSLASKRINEFWARMICVWFLAAPSFFFFKQSILSDIPFVGFVALSLWAFMKYEECAHSGPDSSRKLFYVLSVLLMSYALLIRLAGLILFLAVILYLGPVKRQWRKSLGFILSGTVAALINWYLGSSIAGHFGKIYHWQIADLAANMVYFAKSILDFFIFDPTLAKTIEPAALAVLNIVAPVLFLAATALFIYRLSRRDISFLGCFTFLYAVGVVFWPVSQGIPRYILPIIIPIALYLVIWIREGFKNPVAEKFLIGFFVLVIAQSVFIMGRDFKRGDDEVYKKESLEMAAWVIQHLKEDEHYMFEKPRALRLMTQRTGAAFWVYPKDKEEWYRRVKPLKISYLISQKGGDDISRYDHFHIPVDQSSLDFIRVWENSRYKIFKVSY
jgi:hypothetical protein